MKCVTGKIGYRTEELAKEALIQNHIRRSHRDGSGPINVYQCNECGEWHFTSKGDTADFLTDKEVMERIKREQRALDWEGRF
ncbi:MAG: hypothetical protein AAGA66_09710 [Bacteroidota bacterium]